MSSLLSKEMNFLSYILTYCLPLYKTKECLNNIYVFLKTIIEIIVQCIIQGSLSMRAYATDFCLSLPGKLLILQIHSSNENHMGQCCPHWLPENVSAKFIHFV